MKKLAIIVAMLFSLTAFAAEPVKKEDAKPVEKFIGRKTGSSKNNNDDDPFAEGNYIRRA